MQADTLTLRRSDWLALLQDQIDEYEEDHKQKQEKWVKETMPLVKEHINKLTNLLESLRNGTIPESLEEIQPQSRWRFPPGGSCIHDDRVNALEAYRDHIEDDVCISLKEYKRLISQGNH